MPISVLESKQLFRSQDAPVNQGTVFDIMRYSTRDGPGIRTTVFLKGCPLRCAWCHNPESQRFAPELMLRPQFCIGCGACLPVCPNGAIQAAPAAHPRSDFSRCTACGACASACYAEARVLVGRRMTTAEVMAEVRKDRAFYDQSGGGVTFSGGEALAQPAFTLALLVACRAEGISTAVDTSGYVPWRVLAQALPLTGLFLYDLKAVDDATHRRYTGVSNRRILANLSRLSAAGARISVRVPVIPGINDSPAALDALCRVLTALPALPTVELLPYHESGVDKYQRLKHDAYTLHGVHPPAAETMQEITARLAARGILLATGV